MRVEKDERVPTFENVLSLSWVWKKKADVVPVNRRLSVKEVGRWVHHHGKLGKLFQNLSETETSKTTFYNDQPRYNINEYFKKKFEQLKTQYW